MGAISAIEHTPKVGGSSLQPGDYLSSPKRLYFGLLQPDGRFVVYRGSGPEAKGDELWSSGPTGLPAGWDLQSLHIFGGPDKRDNMYPTYLRIAAQDHNPPGRWHNLWKSSEWQAREKTRAIIRDDGDFCVYGTGSPAQLYWESRATDPVVDYDISKIEYDIANAKILSAMNFSMATQDLENDTDDKQTSTISGSQATAVMSGWSDALAIKVGAKTNIKSGIPFIADAKVEVSFELSNTYTWNGSDTTTLTFTWSAPVTVGPHQKGHVLVQATKSTVEVPYSMSGDVVYKSGKRVAMRVSGVYRGENSHSVKITMTSERMGPKTALGVSEPGQPQVIPATVRATPGR